METHTIEIHMDYFGYFIFGVDWSVLGLGDVRCVCVCVCECRMDAATMPMNVLEN